MSEWLRAECSTANSKRQVREGFSRPYSNKFTRGVEKVLPSLIHYLSQPGAVRARIIIVKGVAALHETRCQVGNNCEILEQGSALNAENCVHTHIIV